MEIESSFSAALDIVMRCKARYRHRFHGSFSFRFHNDIVAIPVWKRDVAQHDVELFGVDHVQRGPGVVSRGNIVTEMIQQPRQRLERVAVILYDENSQTFARIILRPRSILAHLSKTPRSPIIGFFVASRCNFGVAEIYSWKNVRSRCRKLAVYWRSFNACSSVLVASFRIPSVSIF